MMSSSMDFGQRLINMNAPVDADFMDSDDDNSDGAISSGDDEEQNARDNAGIEQALQKVFGKSVQEKRLKTTDHSVSVEKEMEDELTTAFALHTTSLLDKPSSSGAQEKSCNAPKLKNDLERSEEEEDEDLGLTHPSNDDLLYDPDLDDLDSDWIDQHRRTYLPKADRSKPLPNSDAVLNCPCCMITLCLDCQRHELYKTQYRAMFVMNCSVNHTEQLHCPPLNGRRKAPKRKANDTNEAQGSSEATDQPPRELKDVFNPVHCSFCNTEVGVYDSDDIYHFFNVLASH